MNTPKCRDSAVPTECCRVARPEREGAAHMRSVWASINRSSRGYPLREAERGVRKSHVYTCTAVREGDCDLYFRIIGGAGVPLKGGV